MSLSRSESRKIAERYASAMLDLAREDKAAPQLADELEAIASLWASVPELRKLVDIPSLSATQKQQALDAALKPLKLSELGGRSVGFLLKQGRLNTIADLAESFRAKLSAESNELQAEVISARPLSAERRGEIEKALAAASGKTVRLRTREDEKLLGGYVLKVGGKLLDHSTAGKLRRLERQLKAAPIPAQAA